MKTIKSDELGIEPLEIGNQVSMLDTYSGLQTPYSDDVIVLSEVNKYQIERFAIDAAGTYGDSAGIPEPTLVENRFGLPALVVRVDCTVNSGQIMPYEMEDSPSGIGVSDIFVKQANGIGLINTVLDHYDNSVGNIPTVLISGDRKHGTDDEIVVGKDRYHYIAGSTEIPKISENTPLIVKAIPGAAESHLPYLGLQDRCLAPLVTEGDKSYAERTGLLSAVIGPEDLLRNEAGLRSQVLKSRVGSMAMGVSVYLTPDDRALLGKGGQVKQGRLVRDLDTYISRGGALVQEFHPPFQLSNTEGRNNGILRVFVLLGRHAGSGAISANAIGGAYVARRELIVHGASNAISGAVLVQ